MSYIYDDDSIYILDISEPRKVQKDVYFNHQNVAQHGMRICVLSLEAAILAQKTRRTPDKNENSYPWTTEPSSLIHFLCNYTSLDQREEMECGP